MKTFTVLGVGALLGCLILPARVMASPGGFTGRLTPYRTYATDGVSELHLDPIEHGGPRKWSFGVYAEAARRRLENELIASQRRDWDAESLMMFVGYDALSFLTLLGGAGRSEAEIGEVSYGSDAGWLLGARMRILDFLVFDPMQGADLYWCRIDAAFHFQASDTESRGRELDWHETRGTLTASFVTRPSQLGSLDTVGIYFGPAFSRLKARETNPRERWEGSDEFGLVAGVFMNPGRHTMLKLEVSRFERNSFNFAAGFHF